MVGYAGYLIVFLLLRFVGGGVGRIKTSPRVEGWDRLCVIVVAVMAAFGAVFDRIARETIYRPYSYSGWQFTNWFWTLRSNAGRAARPVICQTGRRAIFGRNDDAIAPRWGRRALWRSKPPPGSCSCGTQR